MGEPILGSDLHFDDERGPFHSEAEQVLRKGSNRKPAAVCDLNQIDLMILRRVSARHVDRSDRELIDFVKSLPECAGQRPGPMAHSAILTSLGFTPDEIASLLRESPHLLEEWKYVRGELT